MCVCVCVCQISTGRHNEERKRNKTQLKESFLVGYFFFLLKFSTMQLVVVHTLPNDGSSQLMMMVQRQFVVIAMHSRHLMLLDYHQNLDA